MINLNRRCIHDNCVLGIILLGLLDLSSTSVFSVIPYKSFSLGFFLQQLTLPGNHDPDDFTRH